MHKRWNPRPEESSKAAQSFHVKFSLREAWLLAMEPHCYNSYLLKAFFQGLKQTQAHLAPTPDADQSAFSRCILILLKFVKKKKAFDSFVTHTQTAIEFVFYTGCNYLGG